MDADTNTPMKRCSKCGEEKPATSKYFNLCKSSKDGFQYHCKVCVHQTYLENRERIGQKHQQWRLENPEYFRRWRLENPEYERQHYQARREGKNRHRRRRYESNKEHYVEYQRQWRLKNPERYAELTLRNRLEKPEYFRQYRIENRERIAKYNLVHQQKRRARKRSLPSSWTPQDWRRCLEYWHYCCAVCGHQLRDLFGQVEPHQEHWIPLDYKGADNPGTVPGNMLPLCSPCNLSKWTILPEKWLAKKYGKRKAKEIIRRIEAYFEWVKQQ